MKLDRLLLLAVCTVTIPAFLLGTFGVVAAYQSRHETADYRLMKAVWNGDAAGVCGALAEGADPNAVNRDDEPPRTLTVMCGDMLDGRFHRPTSSSETALQMAVRVGNPSVVQMLLQASARSGGRDELGMTLLQKARFLSDWGRSWCAYGAQLDKQRGTDHRAVLALLVKAGVR
jgi:hypothetical protein